MKKFTAVLAGFLTTLTLLTFSSANALAEDKPSGGQVIPKLQKTANDPVLTDSRVYPFWGPVCQRYTYSVVYKDKESRPPEYIRIYFNGDWIDIEKEDPKNVDYKNGVKYIYQFVPKKRGSNFYFFEASNGLGKARDGIIDSPDNGPVLFASAFDNNEIALIDAVSGEKVWNYPTGKEWVGGVALSSDGKYLAAQTSSHVYLFDTSSREPKWTYTSTVSSEIGGDVKGGISISSDGSRIFALLGNRALLFTKDSGTPVWAADTGDSGYNAAISPNGKYAAAATAGTEEDENSNLLILWDTKSSERLWQYHSSGNFHDVSFSADGSLLAAATGCPDRRAYIFSKDSNQPLWQSEMLTRDSPIHQAAISADGAWAAFGAESEGGAVHLYSKESGGISWKFPAPNDGSFRALDISPSGEYIGGATMPGSAYIFSKDSKNPLASWQIEGSLGAAAVAPDGSFLAVGGTDNKVRILDRATQQERASVALGEHIGEIDVSGDGRFVAAGTSGSVYFFESIDDVGIASECTEIIEPPAEGGMRETTTVPRETQNTGGKWPGMLFGFGFLGSILGLGGYFAIVKWQLLRRFRVEEIKLKKIVVVFLSLLVVVFLILTIVSVVMNRSADIEVYDDPDKLNGAPGRAEDKLSEEERGQCGNSVCEDNVGETSTTCPSDCSPSSD